MADDWPCEAYGPEGLEVGVRCFFANGAGRHCSSPAQCHALLDRERRRVFDRIQELAAAGDPVALTLAEEFTSPDQLLGGGGT